MATVTPAEWRKLQRRRLARRLARNTRSVLAALVLVPALALASLVAPKQP